MGGVLRRLGAFGLACLFALTGCAGGRAQQVGPRAIAALSSGRSAASSPASQSRLSITSGPVSGVDGWVAALNRASAAASLDPLRMWALPTCPCLAGVAAALTALADQHLHVDVEYRVSSATLIARRGMNADLTVRLSWRPYDVLSAAGVPVRTEAAGQQASRYSLQEVGDRWLVAVIS